MQPTICNRCKKNMAVIFITKVENDQSVHEGICLKCAKELNIKPIQEVMEKMGITDDDMEMMTAEVMDMLGGENPMLEEPGEEGDEEEGKTATFPFLNRLFGGNQPGDEAAAPEEGVRSREKAKKDSEKPPKRKFLDNYCISLTDQARAGKLDGIIGREQEINRVVQILNRRQKNNPCLIGEPGVGKTAIAEGLALRMVRGEAPQKLLDKEVLLLDLTALVAGTQFRGQFESRMKGLIEEIKKCGNIILVIDEVHNIVGAGDAEGSMNAANILKPALSRGEIQVIGATTFSEYRKHIEKDAALERRFQPVVVNEPSIDDCINILQGIKHYYEDFHKVKISDQTARQAVILSERYITDRFLPDKAIDLIDEASSEVNLKNVTLIELAGLKKELAHHEKALAVAMEASEGVEFKTMSEHKTEIARIKDRISVLESAERPEITIKHLANVIELWTKIPASNVEEQEFKRISQLENRLKERIIGQDPAISAIVSAIRRNRVGISPKRKPVSFIFVGPTGVGKTELVKCLATDLFDTPESLIRLDMSEFMEKHSVSRIIGAPPGYVGYEEAGQLTEKIRRKPYSVVLFDEIEKSHPDVLNVLLQILDDGRITDAQGRTINFENTIIVMTSNAGSNQSGGTVGFGMDATEQSKEKATKALSEIMRPEFINRVDEIIAFNQLSKEDFKNITGILLAELRVSLAERGMALECTPQVIQHLADTSYSVKYGARNLRRLIQKEIEDKIALLIINSYSAMPSKITVDIAEGQVSVTAEQ